MRPASRVIRLQIEYGVVLGHRSRALDELIDDSATSRDLLRCQHPLDGEKAFGPVPVQLSRGEHLASLLRCICMHGDATVPHPAGQGVSRTNRSQRSERPPSIATTWPVTKPDAVSSSRKRTAPTTSAVAASRPIGMRAMI